MLRSLAFALLLCVSAMVGHTHAGQQLGTVDFPTTCTPAARPAFDRGVALLHSFQYDEANQAFDEASRQDARCAMCHWGKAMVQYHPLMDWPTVDAIKRGRQEIARARRLGTKSFREAAYLTAAAAFFQERSKLTRVGRVQAYSDAMARVHRDFPSDHEAAAFYALSLIALAVDDVDDLSNRRQAISILAPMFHEFPDHPGAAHYLIHAADRPELAPLGLEAARRYADIAPASSHALHMPSHIFVRLGMWEETIALNLRAATAGAHAAMEHRGDYTYQIHAMDYLRYAYLQSGREAKARALQDELSSVPAAPPKEKAADRAYFAGRTAIELHRWSEAATLPIPNLPLDWLSDAFWARAIGASHNGDVEAARENLIKLRASLRALQAGRDSPAEDMPIAQLEAEAWVAHAEGNNGQALDYLSRAAAREEASGGESIAVPAREMLADMLLELKRPSEALAAYTAVIVASPNRFDALFGAGEAARMAGDGAASREYFRRLLRTVASDADRPEIATVSTALQSE